MLRESIERREYTKESIDLSLNQPHALKGTIQCKKLEPIGGHAMKDFEWTGDDEIRKDTYSF